MTAAWTPWPGAEDCPSCGCGSHEVRTTSQRDGFAYDGDLVRCRECGQPGEIAAGDGCAWIEWDEDWTPPPDVCVGLVPAVCEYGISITGTVWSTSAAVVVLIGCLEPCVAVPGLCHVRVLSERLDIWSDRAVSPADQGRPA